MLRSLGTRLLALVAVLSASFATIGHAAERLDDTPRTVVMTAYAPEWNALTSFVDEPVPHEINGWRFIVGKMEGKPIVLMESGVSIVNAAMNTQIAIDRFNGTDTAAKIWDAIERRLSERS